MVLLQRLAEAGDVAVPEDAQAAGEEAVPPPVALDVLGGEEAHERLGDGERDRAHAGLPSRSDRTGMASAQASCAATWAPAALASRIVRSSGQPLEQAVHERAAERVAGAEAADDVDRDGGHLDPLLPRARERALRPALDHGELHAQLEQRLGRRIGVARADGDLDLLAVAHRDGGVGERRALPRARVVALGPEHRAVVEVVDRYPRGASGPSF